MNKLTYIILLIFAFSLSCNTKQENKASENIKINNENLSILFTKAELNSKNLDELKLIRNEIYARKGYVFKNKELQKYFSKKEWYTPKKNEEITLSEKEKQNVDLIKQVEANKKKDLISIKTTNSELLGYRDTIAINYKDNKEILNALTLFPETNMGSWDWSQKDRIDMVNYIKKNNFVIDSTEMFLNIKYVKPNTFGMSIVDGFWTLSIYDIDIDNKIVITNDIVGDGNSYTTYELSNKKLKITNSDVILGDYFNELLKNNTQECADLLEDNMITFDYDFSNPEFIEISSWAMNQKEDSECFKGNTIILKLNQLKHKFDINDILWKDNGE